MNAKGKHLTAHTLRKIFALRYYELARATEGDYRALNELSKQLHPASTDITRRYIGLEEAVVQHIFDSFGGGVTKNKIKSIVYLIFN